MTRRSGRMGTGEGIGLAFAVSLPLVFLTTPAYLAETAGSASWATPILGGVAGGALLYILLLLTGRYPGDLLGLSARLLGKAGPFLIGGFYFAVFFATACLWTRQFAENTLLTALPAAEFDNVLLWYGLSAMLLAYLGIETVGRANYVLLPFGLGGLALVLAGLAPIANRSTSRPSWGTGWPPWPLPPSCSSGRAARWRCC